jgi:hypothetical protein
LHCLRALTAAKCFSIYPYQIGQNNDEAIDSGAFWFYRKLGFRPGRSDLQNLCEREAKRIAANPKYRTPRRTLRRLAEAPMFFEMNRAGIGERTFRNGTLGSDTLGKGTTSSRAVRVAKLSTAAAARGPWDTFSTRNLGLHINRRMARDFDGDCEQIRQASTTAVTRALKLDPAHWTQAQVHSLENWSLVLALIPDLPRWAADEKNQLIKIIRAKSAPNEMSYLRQTQRHPRLRAELLRLGSK